jgi:hypothetical protein
MEHAKRETTGVDHAHGAARGMAMMAVLIVLILLSVAAVGLVRMVDTGSLILGNLAFREGTTAAADHAVEDAIGWLRANQGDTALFEDARDNGYYASSLDGLDPLGRSASPARILIDWEGNACAHAAAASFTGCLPPTAEDSHDGYSARYLIARMCRTAGDPGLPANSCATPVGGDDDASVQRGEVNYTSPSRQPGIPNPYFRIVVRAQGPRKTFSYTESYVHF